jgi:hypothetical protein
MWFMWNLISVRSETMLVLEEDRCTVCAKRTISLEIHLDAYHMLKIILDAPDGILGDEA